MVGDGNTRILPCSLFYCTKPDKNTKTDEYLYRNKSIRRAQTSAKANAGRIWSDPDSEPGWFQYFTHSLRRKHVVWTTCPECLRGMRLSEPTVELAPLSAVNPSPNQYSYTLLPPIRSNLSDYSLCKHKTLYLRGEDRARNKDKRLPRKQWSPVLHNSKVAADKQQTVLTGSMPRHCRRPKLQ